MNDDEHAKILEEMRAASDMYDYHNQRRMDLSMQLLSAESSMRDEVQRLLRLKAKLDNFKASA